MTLTADQRLRNEENNKIVASFKKKKAPVTQGEIEAAIAEYKAKGGKIKKEPIPKTAHGDPLSANYSPWTMAHHGGRVFSQGW